MRRRDSRRCLRRGSRLPVIGSAILTPTFRGSFRPIISGPTLVCDAVEHGLVQGLPLNELLVDGKLDVFADIVGSRYLQLSLRGNDLRIIASRYVGIIPLNERVAVRVSPKTPLPNLLRMLAIASHQPHHLQVHLRGYSISNHQLPGILDALLASFLHSTGAVLVRGLLHRYEPVQTTGPFPKGKLNLHRTMALCARGTRASASTTWYARTDDTPENQTLKYALRLLAQHFQAAGPQPGTRAVRSTIGAQLRHLKRVTLDTKRSFLRDAHVRDPATLPFSRAYYAQAIRIAKILIGRQGLDMRSFGGSIRAGTLLLDLESVFEEYVRAILQRDIGGSSSGLVVLNGELPPPSGASRVLFDPPALRPLATPDVVIAKVAGYAAGNVVVEVKYKPLEGTEMPQRADLNQIITYAVAYRSRAAVLVHPAANSHDSGLRLLGVIGSVPVFVYALNLCAADLALEESNFSESIASRA